MNKIFLISLIASAVFIGCGEAKISMQKRNSNITIDGKLNEWDTRSFEPYFDNKVQIKALYDEDYIYFGGQCLDRQIGRRFALNGFVIWIDPEGIKDKDLEVNVKYKGQRKFDFTKGNFFASLNSEQKKKALGELERINDGLLVVNKKNMESRIFPNSTTSSFEGEMLIDKDVLTFEFKIPRHISKIFSEYKDISFSESMLGISYAQSPIRPRMGMMRPDRSPSGNESPAAGMPPGGGRRRGMADFNNEDSEIWVKLNATDK